jgi:hypothetical protein
MQDEKHFKTAVLDHSTSPYFVLVTIVDDRTGQSRTGCTEANFVLGAIHLELNLAHDSASIERADQIALQNADHVFHFSKQKALDNVAFRYTQTDLERARDFIRSHGTKWLLGTPVAAQQAALGSLQWSDAFACAIIEEGLSARMVDMTGQIVAEP